MLQPLVRIRCFDSEWLLSSTGQRQRSIPGEMLLFIELNDETVERVIPSAQSEPPLALDAAELRI